VSGQEKRAVGEDRRPPVEPFLHSVDETEAALFVVLILIVRLGVLLQSAVIFWWTVFVLLGDARHIHLVLSLSTSVSTSVVSIRAGSPRLAPLIKAAVIVGAIAVGVGQILRRAVSSLAMRHV
jgi:hypothetical protein